MSLTLEQFIKDYLKRIDLTERRFDDVQFVEVRFVFCSEQFTREDLYGITSSALDMQHKFNFERCAPVMDVYFEEKQFYING